MHVISVVVVDYWLFARLTCLLLLAVTIVIRGDWFGNSANIKGANKDPRFRLGSPRPCTIFCFGLIRYA